MSTASHRRIADQVFPNCVSFDHQKPSILRRYDLLSIVREFSSSRNKYNPLETGPTVYALDCRLTDCDGRNRIGQIILRDLNNDAYERKDPASGFRYQG
jgi:hypothetical protein